jgi:Ca-activated chloride channel family protein
MQLRGAFRFGWLLCFIGLCFIGFWPLRARAVPAHAPAPPERVPFSPAEAQAGALVFYDDEDDDGGWLAPELTNRVEIRVTGLIARAQVTQSFENLSDEIVHAVYVFPLPDGAAVDGLTLTVGKRTIKGEIRERQAAERSYEQAKRQGKKASLVEQERPNLFTTRVANIAPHEIVQVELSYQEDVRYDAGTFSLVFPSTLTPRYAPGGAEEDAEQAGSGSPHGIAPSFAFGGDGPTLELQVSLDAGFPLAHIGSPSHHVSVTKPGQGTGPTVITLEDGEVPADRDFRLEWTPTPSSAPSSALFEEEFGGERYALLMLLPPAPALDPKTRIARDTSFIIDTSGSMSGTSLEQARAALESGLGVLTPDDRFNVIEFNTNASRLFPESVPATRDNVQRARGWIRKLQADGGTEMLPALDLAFSSPGDPGHLSQVVFVTDGSVGNEADVFHFIQSHLGERRLFTVGIGSAPNQYFLRGAARFGRGTFTSVASVGDVGSRMKELWGKLSTPRLSELGLTIVGDPHAETWPERLPDLYQGEPLVVVAKLAATAASVQLHGSRAGQSFTVELPLRPGSARPGTSSAHREQGIHRLWARRKIETLTDRMSLGESEAELAPEVTRLALRHRLLSKYTSLVAVDRVRSVDGEGSDVAVPNALPAGNDMFGNLPQTATPGPTCLLVSALSVASAWVVKKRARPC